MHKDPVGFRFIIASKECSTKLLSKNVSKVFKLIYNQIENFHDKSTFYSNYKQFWVVQNSFPVVEKMNKINQKNAARSISTFDFSTLYTKIDHKNLIDVLNSLIDFVFRAGSKKYIDFSKSKAFWTNFKNKDHNFFTKASLKSVVKHLITESFFCVGNYTLIQTIGIPMGIDPAPFWANLYLYKYEKDFMKGLISKDKPRALRYHGAARFIDDQCCLNDSGDFGRSFKSIYPKELELKIEHQGEHATFLDLDITISEGKFVYKLFDKRDAFPFFIVRMPHLDSNIPPHIYYGSVLSEFLRIARCTMLYMDFLPRAKQLFDRMLSQGGEKSRLLFQLKKAMSAHPMAFANYQKAFKDIEIDLQTFV